MSPQPSTAGPARGRDRPGLDIDPETAGRTAVGGAAVAGAPPVALPESIQSHGFLLGIDPATAVVRIASANLVDFLGVQPAGTLGRTLAGVLGAGVTDGLPLPDARGWGDMQPRTVRLPPLPGAAGSMEAEQGRREPWDEFEVIGHRSGDLWLLEFEPAAANVGVGSLYNSFRRSLDHLRTADGVAALCAAAVQEVRALTGYDRVFVYRLDAEVPGEVIAEARRPDMEPYLGLSWPAGDLPREARALRLRNWLRLIVDIEDQPTALLRAADAAAAVTDVSAAAPLDLTMAVLRSVSDDERQSLRGMGVTSTLTVSLVVDGRLWGMLTCHHQSPRRISHHVRASCEMLGRVLSLQVRAAQARIQQERASRLDGLVAEVVTAMSLADSLEAGAAEVPRALLGMVAADGVVLQMEGRRITVGRTPARDDIDGLVTRVATLAGADVPPWCTDALPAELAAAGLGEPPAGGSATGVLYVPFGGRDNGFALWLRAELVRTVSWAGEPEPGGAPTSRGSLRPQEEVVQGRSLPWLAAERAAAETFANALPALLLHRAQRVLIEEELAASADRLSAAADRQQLEHQLHQHQRLESLGQLAGGVAHDFNNLLAVILNYAEFVGDEVDTEARAVGGQRWQAAQEDIEQIKGAARRAADLTRRLLAFARREVVYLQAVSLNTVIRGLEQLLRRSIGAHVELVTELAEDLRPLFADPGQLEQILINLAVNARDAMPAGGTLTISTADVDAPGRQSRGAGAPPEPARGVGPGRYVQLTVRDSGTGIPPEIVDRVFEPFFTTKPRGDGTGLGLATVHGIVQQVGGAIEIESEPGLGTTFTMVFPATNVLPSTAGGAAGERPRGGGETVLIVEDGDDLREVTRRLLSRAGYDVLAVANGYEALEIAAQHASPIDLLLTDVIMPFMTGDEVATRFRALYPEIRILFMSGYAGPALGGAGGSVGSDYPMLDKPFSRSALLIKVLEVLDQPPVVVPV